MKYSEEILLDKKQTGYRIKNLISRFANDLDKVYVYYGGVVLPLSQLRLSEIFDYIKNIPYRKDATRTEVVSRPKHIIDYRNIGMDCKKKTILMGSWLKKNKIPYRIIASSRKKNGQVHHVFPQGKLKGRWVNLDATYSRNQPFRKKIVTNVEVL